MTAQRAAARPLLLRGGRVLDPSRGLDARLDVRLAAGRIAEVGADLPAGEAEVLDCGGRVVAPGFVDLHVHLREPGREDEETVESGTRAAAAGGFTAVCAMPNTDPVADSRGAVESLLALAARAGFARVHPVAAATRGSLGAEMTEVGDLVDAGAVAVSDDGRPVADAGLVRRLLEYLRLFDVPFVQHAEDLSLSAAGVMHEGTVSTRLGLRGIPAAAEEVVLARDLLLAERTGGRYHAAHVSTARGAELIAEARHRGARATAEVTPHHLLLDHEAVSAYDTNAKVNPPLRTPEDREALVAALAGGTIDAVATDHAPHHADEKDRPFPEAPFGIVGLETAFALLHTELVLRGRLRLEQLVERMSTGPARIFRLPGGTLAPGGAADVTVLDLDEEWTVQPERFLGLSRNTPFAGRRVRGRACLTIVGGHVVWARERAAGTGEGSGTARVEGDPGAGDGRREGSPARAARDRSRGSAGARRRAASTSGGA